MGTMEKTLTESITLVEKYNDINPLLLISVIVIGTLLLYVLLRRIAKHSRKKR